MASLFTRVSLALAVAVSAPVAVQATPLLDYVGECVPFARAASGIQIYGDAWTWWGQAEGHYARGHKPRVGSVIVFAKSAHLALGHVGVISRVVEERVLMITHANWSRVGGVRGHVEQDVTLFDVSKAGDWSTVRVWYRDNDGLGSTSYPVAGFVYPDAVKGAPAAHHAAELTGHDPDYVGSLIDAYAR